MKQLQSIRFRILLSCLFLALLTNLLHGYLVSLVEEESSDDIFNWHIANHATHYFDLYSRDPEKFRFSDATPFPGFMMLSSDQAFINRLAECSGNTSDKDIPESLTDWPQLTHTDDESHRTVIVYEIACDNGRYHVASLPVTEHESFFLAADITSFSPDRSRNDDDMFTTGFIMNLFSLLSALLLGIYLTRRAVLPLSRLKEDVNQTDITQADSLQYSYYADEVGALANHINQLLKRIRAFILREQQFSRDASHELRTPLTSSKMATELALNLPQGQHPEIRPLLERIDRANNDMTHLIRTFLLLGKEDIRKGPESDLDLHRLIGNVCHNHHYCLTTDAVTVRNNIKPDTVICAQEQLLIVVMSNMIRNAFQYTNNGVISIDYSDQTISVTNTLSGSSHPEAVPESDRNGFGMQIINRICEAAGWQFSFSQKNHSICHAELTLHNKPD